MMLVNREMSISKLGEDISIEEERNDIKARRVEEDNWAKRKR